MSTALLVVDVQRDLVDALKPARRAEFLYTLDYLISRARGAGAAVVYIRHADDELRPETPGWQIADEIAPRPTDAIVEKTYRDAFRDTDLQQVLSRGGVHHVVICGMQTEFCVDSTMREAERRGYRVTLAADGTATYAAGEATEDQIRAQVHRVALGSVAEVVPVGDLFADTALTAD